MQITAYQLAQRFVGIEEADGPTSDAQVLAMLRLDARWVEDDETPWCSAFVNYIAWLLRLPRSKSLAARSWLTVGTPIPLEDARPHFDVVILSRGEGLQPGPEVIRAPGHVGFFASLDVRRVWLLGGNQNDSVSVAPYSRLRILGVRRLWEEV
jgi:uncharacterized protein (TIGR02594 family)